MCKHFLQKPDLSVRFAGLPRIDNVESIRFASTTDKWPFRSMERRLCQRTGAWHKRRYNNVY
jgi:hypothetical protein